MIPFYRILMIQNRTYQRRTRLRTTRIRFMGVTYLVAYLNVFSYVFGMHGTYIFTRKGVNNCLHEYAPNTLLLILYILVCY